MHYWKLGLVAISTLGLAACSSSQSSPADWLEGNWYSSDWSVTYQLEEDDGKWTIEQEDSVYAKDLSLTVDKNSYTLTEADGTTYQIEKVDQNTLTFQQVAAEGLVGTTAAVEFTRVGD